MGNSSERPVPGAPPDVSQPRELLLYLLEVEMGRLEVARRIEAERKIVFPETTVIIRDIQKLHAAIYGRQDKELAGVSVELPDIEMLPGW